MSTPLLQISDLRAGYGRAEVLHGLNLHADKGSVQAVRAGGAGQAQHGRRPGKARHHVAAQGLGQGGVLQPGHALAPRPRSHSSASSRLDLRLQFMCSSGQNEVQA